MFFSHLLGPWRGVKRSNIEFLLQSQFQRFCIPIFVYVLTYKRYKTYRTRFLFCPLSLATELGLGVRWGLEVPRWSIVFPNMVMWHIKLKGMMSKTECK